VTGPGASGVSGDTLRAHLEQAGEEGDEVGPFVDVLKRLQAFVDLVRKLLVPPIAGKERRSSGYGQRGRWATHRVRSGGAVPALSGPRAGSRPHAR
jgi:hypothetical protein